MSLTPDIERVQEWVDFLAVHEYILNNKSGAICICGFVPNVQPETLQTQQDYYRAHLAEHLAALVTRAEGDHLAAFLAQLPGDLFSETEIQRVREWAGEWSG